MSKTVHVESASHFSSILNSNRLVVVDFYADWCGPCKAIAPVYEQLSQNLSRPGTVAFTKVNTDNHKDITQTYGITAMPTFMVFRGGREIKRIRGADPKALDAAVKQVAQEAAKAGDEADSGAASGSGSGSGSGGAWAAFAAPKGYSDITDAVDVLGLDFLNLDGEFGTRRTLFDTSRPSSLNSKSKDKTNKDWLESDTDDQMMLFIPFQSTVKLHTLQITSVAPAAEEEGKEATPLRPRKIKLYKNHSNVLGFSDGDSATCDQEIDIAEGDWDAATATAKVELRFVRFQNISSLNIFVVSGNDDEEKTRIDRIRFFGETGEKRAMGKLEKMGQE